MYSLLQSMLEGFFIRSELEDALGGDADLLVPDAEGLVVGGGGLVAGEHGGVEPVGLQAYPLGGVWHKKRSNRQQDATN